MRDPGPTMVGSIAHGSLRTAAPSPPAIPFAVKPKAPRLEDTVIDGALSGLWQTLAAEEARIREDPAARTTALLRRVFSQGDRERSTPGSS